MVDHLDSGQAAGEMGKELVAKTMAQLRDLQAASERAIGQLEQQSAQEFDGAEQTLAASFATASKVSDFEGILRTYKANVLATITSERHREAVVRGRVFEKVNIVVSVVEQGMQQELKALLAAEEETSLNRHKAYLKTLDNSRSSKQLEIANAVRKALAEQESGLTTDMSALRMFWKMQLNLMALVASSDTKFYKPSTVAKWKAAELSEDDAEHAKDQLQTRHQEVENMVSRLVTQTESLQRMNKLTTDLENQKIMNGALNRQITDMQSEIDRLRALLEEMEEAHESAMSKMREEFTSKMEGMSRVDHSAAIEAIKQRVSDAENATRSLDDTLVTLEKAMLVPTPSDPEKGMFTSVLAKRKKAEKAKRLKIGKTEDPTTVQLQKIDRTLEVLLEEMLQLKQDAEHKTHAVMAMLKKRDEDTQKQLDKLSETPDGFTHTAAQWDWADIGEGNGRPEKGVQAVKKRKEVECQTTQSGEIRQQMATEAAPQVDTSVGSAQTEGYFTLDALAIRQAKQQQELQAQTGSLASLDGGGGGYSGLGLEDMMLLDPDALQRIEELLALCQDKDMQMKKMQTAIETLTRMVELGKSKPVEEEIVVEHDDHDVDLTPEWEAMVGSLRGELQRAYRVISALEEEKPGATPAIFKSLLRELIEC